jgi:hypothetical protein
MVIRCLVAAVALGALFFNVGCTRIQNAVQVGGAEDATWVYVHTDDGDDNGVFRCTVVEGRAEPLCVRAEIQY